MVLLDLDLGWVGWIMSRRSLGSSAAALLLTTAVVCRHHHGGEALARDWQVTALVPSIGYSVQHNVLFSTTLSNVSGHCSYPRTQTSVQDSTPVVP
jgi:hypothetical protein